MTTFRLQISCLHTAGSNVDVFNTALRATGLEGVDLRHSVRPDLLAAVEREGHLTPLINARTVDALRELCDGADAVLLTCSTLGPAAKTAANGSPIPIMRVDAALATEAVKDGGKVFVLCAVETTVEPTRLLFEAAARVTGAEVVVQLVPGAWEVFKAGDQDHYLEIIARASGAAVLAGATRVALAQASMAGACDLTPAGQRPLNSPVAGLVAAAATAQRRPASTSDVELIRNSRSRGL